MDFRSTLRGGHNAAGKNPNAPASGSQGVLTDRARRLVHTARSGLTRLALDSDEQEVQVVSALYPELVAEGPELMA